MLKIVRTSDNTVIGLTENPVYIRKAANGCYVLCSRLEANGFVFRGNPYHLANTPELDGLDTISVFMEDAGKIDFTNLESIYSMENALCEQDTMTTQKYADIENALCEQDAKGGNT